MKIKYAIMLSALAVAFAVASLWVLLSRGKNARAVRTKFRLGGLMLSVTAMMSASSCDGPVFGPTCYDPMSPEYVTFASSVTDTISVGDSISFSLSNFATLDTCYYTIARCDNAQKLQEGSVPIVDEVGVITIGETDYRGRIALTIWADDKNSFYLAERYFVLN